MDFTTINPLAFAATRGAYQHGLLAGAHAWSGAGLEGKARKWSAHYARSRWALLERLNAACASEGATFRTAIVMDGKSKRLKRRLLVIVDGVDFDFVREVPLARDAKGRPLLP